jgi:DNA-binding transcriptional ArsR family regulator
MNEQTRERVGQLFDALANPARLRITELLCHSQLTVNEIASKLSLGQSATSQYLSALTRAGILAVEQKGASRIYRVRGPRICRILALIEEFCAVHDLQNESDSTSRVASAESTNSEHQPSEAMHGPGAETNVL